MRWRQIKTAPKDGTNLVLKIHNSMLGCNVSVVGCWMAPGGNPELAGWWGAGAMVGTLSLVNENGTLLPFNYDACAITPTHWQPLPTATQ